MTALRLPIATLALATLLLSFPANAQEGSYTPRGVILEGGLSLPFIFTYVEGEVQREFRAGANTPPGYYPYLQERTNSLTFGFSAALVLEELVFRYTFNAFEWDQAIITHISDDQLEIIDNEFVDATADYRDVPSDYPDRERDISDLDLAALQLHFLDFGYRYYIEAASFPTFGLWIGGDGGLTIATFDGPEFDYYFGLHLSPTFGIGYDFSELVSLEAEIRYNIVITEAPADIQKRLNHAEVTGNGLLNLIETFQFATFQFGIRINFPDR